MRKANDKVQTHSGPAVTRNEALHHVLTKELKIKSFLTFLLISIVPQEPRVLPSKDCFPAKILKYEFSSSKEILQENKEL